LKTVSSVWSILGKDFVNLYVMKITFDNVIPEPMKNENHTDGSVWNSRFELESTTFYMLNASSGKGKSTFLNIIYGLRHDFSGKVFFDSDVISQFKINNWADIRSNQISAVFQSLDLFPDLTALENIQVKNNLTNYKTIVEIERMMTTIGIDQQMNNKVVNLSMGQQQRVAIIRALCQPFKWLLLDEPFSHLDDENIKNALSLITLETQKNNAGTILTTLGLDYEISNYSKLHL